MYVDVLSTCISTNIKFFVCIFKHPFSGQVSTIFFGGGLQNEIYY
jgi:hypothetical protein